MRRRFNRLFTQNEPILQLDFDEYLPDQSVVCFEDVTIGLSNSSMWYQWGMDELHEGPLLDPKVTPEHFRKFKNYLIEKMNINIVCPQISYGVLFTRKRTRQILNQNELASSIEKEFEISIQVVGMEDNSIMEIIRIVSCAELLISMHGALMILAMFLPRHAVVVEMYPYAINPEFYQVYHDVESSRFGYKIHRMEEYECVQCDRASIISVSFEQSERGEKISHIE